MRQYSLTIVSGMMLSFSAWATSLELAKPPTFITPNAITLEVIPPPPKAHSPEEKIDLAILTWEQQRRTFYDYQHAWNGVTLEPSYFGEALGVRFEEVRFPQLYALIKAAVGDAKLYTDALKLHYQRQRPYQADPKIKPFIPEEESFSYPSGHGTRGMTTALILAELFPDRREALIQTGRKIGQDRVIGGVHYPSDITSGVKLAEILAKEITTSAAFKAKVKEVQPEIKQLKAIAASNKKG